MLHSLSVSRRCASHLFRLQKTLQKVFATRGYSNGNPVDMLSNDSYIPRRAVLYVPGSDIKKLNKIPLVKADCIVLDCEDGVAYNMKDTARKNICKMLGTIEFGIADCTVRVNSMSSGITEEDLKVVLKASRLPQTIILPKVDYVQEIEEGATSVPDFEVGNIKHCLTHALYAAQSKIAKWPTIVKGNLKTPFSLAATLRCKGAHRSIPRITPLALDPPFIMFTAMLEDICFQYKIESWKPAFITCVETSIGLLNLQAILQRAKELSQTGCRYRLDGVLFGSDDFCADIGAIRTKKGMEVFYARQKVVTTAKAYRLQAIDMVDINYKDLDTLQENCKEGAEMGFTGKQVIHPGQVPVVQVAFSPSLEKVDWAMDLIKQFDEHVAAGKGAFTFYGQMIDMPLLLQAKNIIKMSKLMAPKEITDQ